VSLAYRMQELTREEMAASDPYEGRGVFLPAPGMGAQSIVDALEGRLGMIVPAIAWDGIGAWVDPGSTGMSAALILDRWDGDKTSERG
jgi:hypothetical protein